MDPVSLPLSDNPRLPDPPAPYRHYLPIQTRFLDFDMLGHLNNSIFLTFFDMAKARYFEDVTQKPIGWNNIGLVVVNINCDFFHPVFFRDKIEVFTTVVKLGQRSMTLEQRVVNSQTHATHARCITTMATFDPLTHTSVELPTFWRNAIVAYESRPL